MKKIFIFIFSVLLFTFTISTSAQNSLNCESPYVEYQGNCVDPVPSCQNPPENTLHCLDKIENGVRIPNYTVICQPGYEYKNQQCINTCSGNTVPLVEIVDSKFVVKSCTDPLPPCQNPPANSLHCIDKIKGVDRIERYNFNCQPGYEKVGDQCISQTCPLPYVEYQDNCVDPVPSCLNPPANSLHCVDKIENGIRIPNYGFTCQEGYVRQNQACVEINNFISPNQNTTPIPKAGFEDLVLTNLTYFANPFPDTNLEYLEGIAAAELYRREIIGGFPDGQFKGGRLVNRAEAAKFLILSRGISISQNENNGRFKDVIDGQWYTPFVMTAAEKGIISGYPDGTFKPADPVNTVEFLKMLALTFAIESNSTHYFSDVETNAWYSEYVSIAERFSLFPNRKTQLLPNAQLTRNEVSIAIYQYLKSRN